MGRMMAENQKVNAGRTGDRNLANQQNTEPEDWGDTPSVPPPEPVREKDQHSNSAASKVGDPATKATVKGFFSGQVSKRRPWCFDE